jgi:hypothetical protein
MTVFKEIHFIKLITIPKYIILMAEVINSPKED